ncbi:MAG: hypothetical protein K6E99_04650 [Bacilli bacterium]|nr:hypothetical protein [Bacilli bacterium]
MDKKIMFFPENMNIFIKCLKDEVLKDAALKDAALKNLILKDSTLKDAESEDEDLKRELLKKEDNPPPGTYRPASITVEAVFTTIIILGIIFSLLIIIFSIHDKLIIDSLTNQELFIKENNDDFKEHISNQMLFLEIRETNIKDNNLLIVVSVKAKTKINIPIVNNYINKVVSVKRKVSLATVKPEYMIKRNKDGS